MKGGEGRRIRRESSIARLEKVVLAHEANTDLTKRILEDKKLSKTTEEIEKLRKSKLERAKKCLENTKINLRK